MLIEMPKAICWDFLMYVIVIEIGRNFYYDWFSEFLDDLFVRQDQYLFTMQQLITSLDNFLAM